MTRGPGRGPRLSPCRLVTPPTTPPGRRRWYEQLLPVLFNREHFGVKPGWIPAVFLTDGMGVCQCFRDRKLVKEARQSGAAGAGMAVAGVRAQVLEGRARTSIEFNFKYPASGGGKVAKRAETDPPAQTRLPGRPNPPRSA